MTITTLTTAPPGRLTPKNLARGALAANGLAMLIAPGDWYRAVPGVPFTGPPNLHFVRDIGCAYLVAARALASLALSIVASRTFPALKYALGHGRSCQRLSVESALDVTNAKAASSCQ